MTLPGHVNFAYQNRNHRGRPTWSSHSLPTGVDALGVQREWRTTAEFDISGDVGSLNTMHSIDR